MSIAPSDVAPPDTSTPSSPSSAAPSAAAAVSSPPAGVSSALSGVGTNDYAVQMGANGIPVQGPNRTVLPGEVVEIVPIPTNTVTAYASSFSPDSAKNGPNRMYLLTTNPNARQVFVGRLNEIWVYSTVAGEGILIQVRKTR